MRQLNFKGLLTMLALSAVFAACGTDEDKDRPKEEQPEQADVLSTDGAEEVVPSSKVGNEEEILSEHEEMPDAIIEEVKLDENGKELSSTAQYRGYYGGGAPNDGAQLYNNYNRNGRDDGRIYNSGYGQSRGTGNYGRGHGHGQSYGYGQGGYRYRPHYRSNVHDNYYWVYGKPTRYAYGNRAYYYYPKPRYQFRGGRCQSYYNGYGRR